MPAPRDWSGQTPLQYPDPDIVALDPRDGRVLALIHPDLALRRTSPPGSVGLHPRLVGRPGDRRRDEDPVVVHFRRPTMSAAPAIRKQLLGIAPYFLVSDVVKAAEYYRDALGFSYSQFWGVPPCFCMPCRDGVIIMLSQTRDPSIVRLRLSPGRRRPGRRPKPLSRPDNGTRRHQLR